MRGKILTDRSVYIRRLVHPRYSKDTIPIGLGFLLNKVHSAKASRDLQELKYLIHDEQII